MVPQRTGSQSPVTAQQVFNNKANLPPSCWLQLYRPFSRTQSRYGSSVLLGSCQIESAVQTGIKNMMNWVTHLNPRPAEIKAQVSVCQAYRYILMCLFKHRLCACYRGAAVLLFILLPYSSHKVNCWNDLYLSKHLRDITNLETPSAGRDKNTHRQYVCVCCENTALIPEFVMEP